MSKPAKVLDERDVRRVLTAVSQNRYHHRDYVIVLLSFKAGLRACEIAGLTWPMVLRADGRVDTIISVDGAIAKMGSARRIPMHTDLRAALQALHKHAGKPRAGPVLLSQRGHALQPRSIVNWFRALYAELGLRGCSSHSGRRTFITRSARQLARVGASLRDVQELAGHRSLSTTERYIAGDRDAQRKIVRLI